MGFEPMIRVLQTLALASWPRRLAEGILSEGELMVKQISGKQKSKTPIQGSFRAGDGTRSQRQRCLFFLERAMGRGPSANDFCFWKSAGIRRSAAEVPIGKPTTF